VFPGQAPEAGNALVRTPSATFQAGHANSILVTRSTAKALANGVIVPLGPRAGIGWCSVSAPSRRTCAMSYSSWTSWRATRRTAVCLPSSHICATCTTGAELLQGRRLAPPSLRVSSLRCGPLRSRTPSGAAAALPGWPLGFATSARRRVEALTKHRYLVEKQSAESGRQLEEFDLVFSTITGTRLMPPTSGEPSGAWSQRLGWTRCPGHRESCGTARRPCRSNWLPQLTPKAARTRPR